MGFKLVIANVVEFKVCLVDSNGGKTKEFPMTLFGRRLPQKELVEAIAATRQEGWDVVGFVADHITDWRGQTLVVDDETGQPLPFSDDAFAAMLSLGGAAAIIFHAYVDANAIKGKAGN